MTSTDTLRTLERIAYAALIADESDENYRTWQRAHNRLTAADLMTDDKRTPVQEI